MSFNPSTSILAGMSTTTLQAALANAQQAYLDLSTGAKGESYSYSRGEGSNSVTYTRANLPALVSLIKQLQAQLGIICRSRKSIGFRF